MSGEQKAEQVVTVTLTANEVAAVRHEHSEPYGHEIRGGIFPKLRAALDAPSGSPVDDDHPVLLGLREAICTELEGAGYRDADGEPLFADGCELIANEISDRVKPLLPPSGSPEEVDLVKALALMALGWPYDDFPVDGLYADPFEAEGFLKTGRDHTDEGYCVLTRDGAKFVSGVLAATFTPPSQPSTKEPTRPKYPPAARLVESLRWAISFIEDPEKRRWPLFTGSSQGGEMADDWSQWASALDWLKDAAMVEERSIEENRELLDRLGQPAKEPCERCGGSEEVEGWLMGTEPCPDCCAHPTPNTAPGGTAQCLDCGKTLPAAPSTQEGGEEGGFLTVEDVEVVACQFDSDWELVQIGVETPEESVDMFPEYVVIGLREERGEARRERDSRLTKEAVEDLDRFSFQASNKPHYNGMIGDRDGPYIKLAQVLAAFPGNADPTPEESDEKPFKPQPLVDTCLEIVADWESGAATSDLCLSILRAALTDPTPQTYTVEQCRVLLAEQAEEYRVEGRARTGEGAQLLFTAADVVDAVNVIVFGEEKS
jgi:hypothetical protein